MILIHTLGVQKACCEFLEHQLDPSNCLGIKGFAETHGCEELRLAAENFIHKHFTEIMKSEEFIQLDAKDIIGLIDSDKLTVSYMNLFINVMGRLPQQKSGLLLTYVISQDRYFFQSFYIKHVGGIALLTVRPRFVSLQARHRM